ncbi:MAG: amidohydrolase [Treponema sp.]|nr:amidohydrolase [Treponema sp.]
MENIDLVRQTVERFKPLAVGLSDELAATPELSGMEYKASGKIAGILKNAGFAVEYPFDGLETAFRAAIDNGDGPSVALMVEYDALPGIGHGCGHNLHGAMSVLAGLALTELKELFHGKLYLIGTPDEEKNGAKIKMASDGVFDNMDIAMMIHCSAGISTPAMRCFSLKGCNYTFTGQTAHAAVSPWSGRNALTAARKFLDLLDARRESYTPYMRVSSVIKEGGITPNVIPGTAVVKVEFRAETAARLKEVEDIVFKCAKGASIALDCDMSWEYDSPVGYLDIMQNDAIENAVSGIFDNLGVNFQPDLLPIASSDAGNVSYSCPVSHPLLAIADEPVNFHTVDFAAATQKPLAYDRLATGARALAHLALRTWNDAGFRNSVKSEFERRKADYLKGGSYV